MRWKREWWWINEEGTTYVVDLALPVGDDWLPVTFGDRSGPEGGVHFAPGAEPDACLQEIPIRLQGKGP